MLRKKTFTDNQFEQKSDAFNLSISDLMAGILAIFVLALSYFILNFGQANAQLTQNTEKREELLKEIKEEMKNYNIIVEIDQKKGVLTLPDGILFEEGAIEPNEKGKRVIIILREILLKTLTSEKYKGAIETIFIEGHTDNTKVSPFNPYYKSNWELSVKRAIATWDLLCGENENTSTVLIGDKDGNTQEEKQEKNSLAGLKNKNGESIFSCSGYADTRKIKENDTEENRKANRRIDLRFNIAPPTKEEQEIIQDIKRDYIKYKDPGK